MLTWQSVQIFVAFGIAAVSSLVESFSFASTRCEYDMAYLSRHVSGRDIWLQCQKQMATSLYSWPLSIMDAG